MLFFRRTGVKYIAADDKKSFNEKPLITPIMYYLPLDKA
jgi:hypothetical protein